jgi:hypothetical protein
LLFAAEVVQNISMTSLSFVHRSGDVGVVFIL